MFARFGGPGVRNGRRVLLATSVSGLTLLLADCALAEDRIHAPAYPWVHTGWTSTYDHAALRRGYQVYKEVCAACHPMHRIYYRHLVGVTHTEEQAKSEAATVLTIDGPNDDGEYFQRPGSLNDHFVGPYTNEQEARAANNGAYPPDLSLIINARHDGLNYVFTLLTGFKEKLPEGHKMMEGQYFNPWFPGTAISMAPPLADGAVDYPDGTIATTSQMSKDVCEFLHWCAEPHLEQRKFWAIPCFSSMFLLWLTTGYHKRYCWNIYHTQKIVWKSTPAPR